MGTGTTTVNSGSLIVDGSIASTQTVVIEGVRPGVKVEPCGCDVAAERCGPAL